jgi:hypothetical protein
VKRVTILAFAAALGFLVGLHDLVVWAGTVTQGTLSVSAGDWITGSQLASWIDELIPGTTDRLVVLTECFGGDAAGAYTGKSNTAVASATAAGETSQYGGYDSGAAGTGGASGALRPGAGRTGQSVHDAGSASKAAGESTSTGGGLPLSGFLLEDTSLFGSVQSRHVLIYAGKPDSGAGRDVDQRNTIKSNFGVPSGSTQSTTQPNTSVRAVGGDGTGGWDKPGSAQGLRQALNDIGNEINAAPPGSKEQFILFVTDHGDRHQIETPATPLSVPRLSDRSWTMPTFTSSPSFNAQTLAADPNNVPGFSLFVDYFANGITRPVSAGPLFHQGDWRLDLTPAVAGGQTRILDSFFDVFTELSVDGSNITGDYSISQMTQDSGSLAKTGVPEPSTTVLLALGLVAALLLRRRAPRALLVTSG